MRLNLLAQVVICVGVITGFGAALLNVLTAEAPQDANRTTQTAEARPPYLRTIASAVFTDVASTQNEVQTEVSQLTLVRKQEESARFGAPTRLKVPALAIDVPIERVGMTLEGDVGSPDGSTNAAWFDLGPRPGERGSAIIVGHYGWRSGVHAVFDNLGTLEVGAMISVDDDLGKTHVFVVRELREYEEGALADDVFVASDDMPHLNLITCAGAWNKGHASYSRRLVVFTDMVYE